MKNKPFNVVDKDSFSALKGAELLSVYGWSKRKYLCEDEYGYYKVEQKGSVIFMGYSETENALNLKPVLSSNLKGKITFGFWGSDLNIIKLMEYMEWTCDEDNMWLG